MLNEISQRERQITWCHSYVEFKRWTKEKKREERDRPKKKKKKNPDS